MTPIDINRAGRRANPEGRSLLLFVCVLGVLGSSSLSAGTAHSAAVFPARPIRLIVPFPPGTTTDVVARLVGQRAGDRLAQQIVIDNRAGASGTIGVELAAHATPDGYTWVLGTTSTHALAPMLNMKLAYDPVRDFAPVTLLGEAAYLLTTHPALPATGVPEFIAYAQARPGKLTYGSVGNFSLGHLSGELLKKAAGISLVHVPYKGSPLAIVDLLAGRIDLNIGTIPASLPHVRAGKLRALAVTGRARIAVLPRTPTVAESGLPDYHASLWVGVLVPAATPGAVTVRIHRELDATLRSSELRETLTEQGFEPGSTTPDRFAGLIRDDTARWRAVISEAGLKPQ